MIKVKIQTNLDEHYLLTSIFQGNHNAFWELWLLHQDYLYHRCLRWLDGNHTEAENILSQASLKAWQKLPDYADKITNVKAWLITLTHNLCMDMYKKKSKWISLEIDSSIDSCKDINVKNYQAYTCHDKSSESNLMGNELDIKIDQVMNNLPEKLRSPCIMYFIQEMSYQEIATKLDISLDNVYKRISNARQIMQKSLSEYLLGDDKSILEEIVLPPPKIEKPTNTNLKEVIHQDSPSAWLIPSEASDQILHNQPKKCPCCQSLNIRKNGKRRGKENYKCQKCDRQFVDSYSSKGYSAEIKQNCLNLHSNGMGYRAIGREMGISHKTVINWARQQTT